MQSDIKRLSLILLFAPFALWILLLIIIPHIGMIALSLREKVAPRVYEFGFGQYIDFIQEPIYWNTLIRTGSMSREGLWVQVLDRVRSPDDDRRRDAAHGRHLPRWYRRFLSRAGVHEC